MVDAWLTKLTQHAESQGIVALRLSDAEWASINETKKGIREFSVVRPHAELQDVKARSLCLIYKKTTADSLMTIAIVSSSVFYLKCVKRDARIKSGGSIIMPLEHFQLLLLDSRHRGPRGGVRLSYKCLNGCYLRPFAFTSLIRSGYIGAYSHTTEQFRILVDAVIAGDRAVMAAIQSRTTVPSSPTKAT